MMTNAEFTKWCQHLTLKPEAIEIIRKIRTSPPARNVAQNKQSVVGRYPSRKMGFTIQFESHTVELPLVYKLEHDVDTPEYYCQPSTITLEYLSPHGRLVRTAHTPDYFVMRRDSAGWIEAKSKEALPLLSQEQPNRYRFENGSWVCPPGIAYAQRFGLTYAVHSSADVSPVFTRNANFLDDYLRNPPSVSRAARQAIQKRLELNPIITLAELIDDTAESATRDEIYTLIVQSDLHVDWNAHPFVEPDDVRAFASAETAENFAKATAKERPQSGFVRVEVGDKITWDGRAWSVANVGENIIALRGEGKGFSEIPINSFYELHGEGRIIKTCVSDDAGEHPEVAERIRTAGPEAIEEANKRFRAISAYLDRARGDNKYPKDRSTRRWLADYLEAKSLYGNGMLGLYPKTQSRGNRTPRLSHETRQEMQTFIGEKFETFTQSSPYAIWALLKDECENKGIRAPSFNTFLVATRNRPRYEQQVKRKGCRGAYREKEFYWYLDQTTPRHGDRPFEVAHIDHTELDIELVHLKTGQRLGRPWLTIMTDAHSRRFLGLYLSFDPPSYRSCMMAIRDCVRRHQRMPQIIVVDGGREFQSIYFDQLLARYECTKKTRPAADARSGSTCERLFGTTNTQFIHNLAGNTKITKTVRITTNSNNPKTLAVWDFAGLHEHLEGYAFDSYEVVNHPALSQSPRDAFNLGIARTGAREHRRVAYDMNFIMLTYPTTRKGTVKIRPGRGFLLKDFTYWNDLFRDPVLANKNVPVRYDPFDKGTAWVFVKGRWVECHSNFYADMRGKSEKLVKLATAIDTKRRSISASVRREMRPRVIAERLRNSARHEELNRQQLRDLEVLSYRKSYSQQETCDLAIEAAQTHRPEPGPQLVQRINKAKFEVYERL